MQSVKNWLLLVLSVIVIVETYLLLQPTKPITGPSVITTADSIVSSIQDIHVKHDSTVLEILKTDTIIKYVKEKGNQNYITILNQPLDDDIRDFAEYVESYVAEW